MRKFLLFFFITAVSSRAMNYSDKFAREFMFPLSAAAYSDDPEYCLNNHFVNATIYEKVTVSCRDFFDGNTCSGFIAILHEQKAIAVSFRGTTRLTQLISEAFKSVFRDWFTWFGVGNVSRYFGNAMNTLWYNHRLSKYLLDLTKKYPDYEIWLTGHSLGGALASLATSLVLRYNVVPPEKVKMVTFGQPRTGDKEFSETQDQKCLYCYRVTHYNDMVPHIPNIGYRHHMKEVFYQKVMDPSSYKICSENEDKTCSNGIKIKASIENHVNYFGQHVSSYGEQGCVSLDEFELMYSLR